MHESMKFYTVKEAADILRLTPRTVYINVKNNIIKAKKCGGKILITEEEIKRVGGYDA